MKLLPVLLVGMLVLTGCAPGSSVETLKSKTPSVEVASILELVDLIQTPDRQCIELDSHNETAGASESATCTTVDGDYYLSIFDDPAEQQAVADRFAEPDKGEASMVGANWIVNGPDDHLEALFDAGLGGTLRTASGRFCDEDGERVWCP